MRAKHTHGSWHSESVRIVEIGLPPNSEVLFAFIRQDIGNVVAAIITAQGH